MDEPAEECPLCTEEMDLTDRHLRPCQCGYQICVWCWHHIMEMASKDNSEGRCPACRTPYDRDKIVAARPNMDELLDTVDKKKSHKSRSRTQEGRKHLNTVRVMQRNLVYIVGFPAHLADEELLERREYFGKYGKILKVAVSRNPPHSPTVGVYVTYVKDEDARQCIKAIDGVPFEGKVLKASFGTNKYCHSWLKYSSCNNPDCMYLHDEGLDEDSFTKEEMLAKYGSKNQHFHEHTKPRVGLPPPVPEAATTSRTTTTPKPVGSASTAKVTGLPAAASWGMRASAAKPVAAKSPVACAVKKKPYAGSMKGICKEDEEDTPSTSCNANLSDGMEDYGKGEQMSEGSSSPEDGRGFSMPPWLEPDSESVWRDPRSPSEDSSVLLNVGEVSISLNTGGNEASEPTSGRAPSVMPRSPDPPEDVISALDRIVLDGGEELGVSSSTGPGVTGAAECTGRISEKQVVDDKQAERNIIDHILSMDFGPEGPTDMCDLLSTGRAACTRSLDEVSRKGKQQSRFSFAREDTASQFRASRDDHSAFAFQESQHDHRESTRHSSMPSPGSDFTGSASKPRLFAPPGFAGTPPPGFSGRNINSRPLSPAGRVNEYDLIDPVALDAMQNEQASSRLRTLVANKPLFSGSNVDDMLGLFQQHHGLREQGIREYNEVLYKQQQQQQRLLNERRAAAAAFKYDPISYADGGRIPGQYEESSPYSPGASVNRGYRSMSPHDASWLGGAGAGAYVTDAFSPEMKFKTSLRAGHHTVGLGGSSSLRQAADKSMLFANGNPPSLEHYLNDPSFREADIQGAYV